jgi:exodeoxyribonuclease V alpha subunit
MKAPVQQLALELDSAPETGPLQRTADLLELLGAWVERGWLRRLDRAFVAFLLDLRPDADPRVGIAAALASHQLGHGHICLDLDATLESPDLALSLPPEGDAARGVPLPSAVLAGLDAQTWRDALAGSPLVESVSQSESESDRPLVLSGGRLYLRRYWQYEQQVGSALKRRMQVRIDVPHDLARRLAQLFGPAHRDEGRPATDWQKLACALAARSAFSIITGGPGTGKTTTVVRLLALLQTPAVEAGHPLRIRLAAPTGKAAARLSASIREQVGRLDVAESVRTSIPAEVMTLHRLLGRRPDTRQFRHHAGNPLPLDVLVIDEASMVDLEMMACVLDALPDHARFVLIGDKDQLASVEAGAVLGDLCRDADEGRYSPQTRAWLEQASGEVVEDPALREGDDVLHTLAQHTVMLRHSRRFGQESGIGRLAGFVNAGDAGAARAVLEESRTAPASTAPASTAPHSDIFDLQCYGDESKYLDPLLLDGLPESPRGTPRGYAHYLGILRDGRPPAQAGVDDPAWQAWAKAILAGFDEFRLLCAVRKGASGVEGLNARVANALNVRGLIERTEGWYEGRPVLVTRNDYGLGLMNGDIGIALKVPSANEADGAAHVLRVAFARGDGSDGVRFVLPGRLSAVETVFAMTVHKSQGSEFLHTALILPDVASPVLSRELIYTGVTRARNWFSLIETGYGVFEDAVTRRVRRLSGLAM